MRALLIPIIALAVRPAIPDPEPPRPSNRAALVAIALDEVGTREATGRNDGARVNEYQSVTGTPGLAWCGSFVAWVGVECQERYGFLNVYPTGAQAAWSPTWGQGGSTKRSDIDKARGGDTFQLFYRSLSPPRIGHVGLVESTTTAGVITIEGNTSDAQAINLGASDREGQGVYRKRRPKAGIYSTTDHLGGLILH